jgi:hypothetical protein
LSAGRAVYKSRSLFSAHISVVLGKLKQDIDVTSAWPAGWNAIIFGKYRQVR